VFVCQNNQFAISVPVERQSGNPLLFEKAAAYAIPGERVDGNDAEVVFEAISRAAEQARNGGGPNFIECLTYRVGPHSSSDDPSRYRDEAVTRAWAARDPVTRLRDRCYLDGSLDEAGERVLRQELGQELDLAIAKAELAPPPPTSSLFDDVYAKRPRHLVEQAEELRNAMAMRPIA
jgi:TPP-dependent pyruvate/acetoin dehydrogenase alpha subunit